MSTLIPIINTMTTQFNYPTNAQCPVTFHSTGREIPRPPSPLVAWYGNSAPEGCYVARSGVVTSIPQTTHVSTQP
jgi:hypothetical protein